MPIPLLSRHAAGFSAGVMIATALINPLDARQTQGTGACRVSGHARSGPTPLPGVAVVVTSAAGIKTATSTETDGGYAVNVAPGQYTLAAELTGFASVERPLVIAADGACAQTVDLTLTLRPRQPAPAGAPAARAPQRGAGAVTNVVQVQPLGDSAAQTQTPAERESE